MTASIEDRIRQPERRPPSVFNSPPRRPPSVFTDETLFPPPTEPGAPTVDLVGIVPAAEHIGVPVEQLKQLVERRGIMHYSIDAIPMFDSSDLDAWLNERPALGFRNRGRLAF